MSTRKRAPFHYFTSSVCNWAANNDRAECEKQQRIADGFKNGKFKNVIVRPNGYNVYKVPGDSTRTYQIIYYKPQVKGTKLIEFVPYPEPEQES